MWHEVDGQGSCTRMPPSSAADCTVQADGTLLLTLLLELGPADSSSCGGMSTCRAGMGVGRSSSTCDGTAEHMDSKRLRLLLRAAIASGQALCMGQA